MAGFDWAAGGAYTPVPDTFIDKHMAAAPPVYALAYVLACRYAAVGMMVSAAEAAGKLGCAAEEVLAAWRHWAAAGLAAVRGEGADARLEVAVQDQPAPVLKPAPRARIEKPPAYEPDALARMQQDDGDARYVLALAERMLAKPLTYHEMNAFMSFYDWLGLPPAVIEVLLDYCVSNGHRSVRYMEKVAMDWADNQIETVADAEGYIRLFQTDYREIMRAFGHTRRDPAATEAAYMKKWLKIYKLPLDVIKAACDKTVTQIGQPKFPYADAILTKWHEAGVTTLDEINRIEESFYQNLQTGGKPKRPAPRSKFTNFDQREWDFGKILEMEERYIDQQLGGE